jgi:hypothetical protein
LKESKLFAEPAFASPMNLDPDAGIDDRAEMLLERSMEIRVSFARRKHLHPQSHIGLSRFLITAMPGATLVPMGARHDDPWIARVSEDNAAGGRRLCDQAVR